MIRLVSILFFLQTIILPQNNLQVIVRDAETNEPLSGVNIVIELLNLGAATDSTGLAVLLNIPDGDHQTVFSLIGYETIKKEFTFPQSSTEAHLILMKIEAEELEEVSVTSTRSSRLIEDEPTRVEAITYEEVDEKISMDPSNISMLLNESTGIQVQQTSLASANNTFRIQGLEGRYTQLLKDGLPLYSGFSGSLSINQIPPLDLAQVEIIKGSASTLYSGGAIAGLINLISKQPEEEREISLLLNATSALGLDVSGFSSQAGKKLGYTMFVSRNTQNAYDNNDDNFSDLPEIERYTINPNFFFYLNEDITLQLGGNLTFEDRTGGSISAIEGGRDSVFTYSENHKSNRFSTQLRFDYITGKTTRLSFRNTVGYFQREITLPDYSFKGNQVLSYSELTYSLNFENSQWVGGLNFSTDKFRELSDSRINRNYQDNISGAFIQGTYNLSLKNIIEAGVRTDYNKDYSWFFLPRLSFLTKWNEQFTTRIGGGLGYKIPNIFTERAEELNFRNFGPINQAVSAEKSYGVNFDFNYKTIFLDVVTFSFNNLFFYTRIQKPVELFNTDVPNDSFFEFRNSSGHYDTRGFETNIKLTYDHYKLFTGYTFVDARRHTADADAEFFLTPKHRIGIILMYEEHENLRIGLEAYYTGQQKLFTGERARDYWITGLMIEKRFENLSLFLNFENFLDTRQSRFGRMYTGNPSNPIFAEIYAPTDGRIINAGVKWNL